MKKIINTLVLFLMTSTILISCRGGNTKLSKTLRDNLGNLNGVWSYNNTKEDELWNINICYDKDSKSGTYVIKKKRNAWGGNKEDIQVISEGSFILEEGYDVYGDKAYIGKNTSTGRGEFAIVRLDTKIDGWALEPVELEREMLGSGMDKVSNECK